MAINLAAEHMQGYNNPSVDIINIEMSGSANVTTEITYEDVEKILARGGVPIVVLWAQSPTGVKIRYILPLAYTGDREIKFAASITGGTSAHPSCNCIGLIFALNTSPKIINWDSQSMIG